MSRDINRAESWEKVYEAYQQINFAAWDYVTIKESLLDYLKIYHPEDFSDYIESSEFIVVLELFAYICELVAYRLDLNAHENFITDADRKESILRLAKFLSYKVYRNIPARGLVKIKSISTSEKLFDSNGNDISNKYVTWNDPVDSNWKEKFLLILNKSLEQPFGSVLATDRIQVQDVLFELYSFNNEELENGVIPFNASISTNSLPFELVSSMLDENGPYEKRPEKNQKFNILYASDGLGDTSDNTGFFIFVKQGTLQKQTYSFDGITPNQTIDILIDNCNNSDVWVNNVDPDTGEIIVGTDLNAIVREGEWEEVDLANSQNIVFNTNPNRNKFEVETLDRDRFRLIFGDGKFANIPSGTFDIWYRVSANAEFVVPTNAIQNTSGRIQYTDKALKRQSLSFTFSLVDPIQNSAPSEDIESIRRIAPSVYFTQDRMVNAKDYNEFLLQDNSILKLKAINRTFAGDSKYVYWHDPRNYYENVKLFGEDLVVYFRTTTKQQIISSSQLPAEDGGANTALIDSLIDNYIVPIFDTEEYFIKQILDGVSPNAIRKNFTPSERSQLEDDLLILINNIPGSLYLSYSVDNDIWSFSNDIEDAATAYITLVGNSDNWELSYLVKNIVVHSDELKFWISNDDRKVITYDTLNTNYDSIVILSANTGVSGCSLARNYSFRVIRQDIIDVGVESGLESIHDLLIIPNDDDNDGIPDDVSLPYLFTESEYVYFTRENTSYPWVWKSATAENIAAYELDQEEQGGLWKRENGKQSVNFLWLHRTPRYHLVDPSPSNIIDMFVLTRGYYTAIKLWLSGKIQDKPSPPNTFTLRGDYAKFIGNKMISDSIILHPGKIKPIIGEHAIDSLKAKIKVIRSPNRKLSNNQIKTIVVDAVKEYFDINKWEFGQTFYFTSLASFIHNTLPVELDSVVLVPTSQNHVFGDLMQVFCKEDEIIQPSISVDDIEIVQSLSPTILKQNL